MERILQVIGLCLLYVLPILANINMQGCTESFVRLTCPDDDILQVVDLRFTKGNKGDKCVQQKPASGIIVPKDIAHLCNNDQDGGPTCFYAEDICEGVSDCVFYVSPHLIAGKEEPTTDSEVLIDYHCYSGSRRKAGVGVAGLLAVVGLLSILIIGFLLLRRMWSPPADYNNFSNASARAAPPVASTSTGSTIGMGSGSPYGGGPCEPEHISVELQPPSLPSLPGDNGPF